MSTTGDAVRRVAISSLQRICSAHFSFMGRGRTQSKSTYIISLVCPVWSSFPSIRPVIRPSKFLIPEEEDDGRGGGGRQMAAAAVYEKLP